MPATKHSVEQIIAKLREVEKLTAQGMTIPMAAKKVGITDQTLYRWRIRYGALKEDALTRWGWRPRFVRALITGRLPRALVDGLQAPRRATGNCSIDRVTEGPCVSHCPPVRRIGEGNPIKKNR